MKKQDDYIERPHSYWIHFWWGVDIGALRGLRIGWKPLERGRAASARSGPLSLGIRLACGRWGDTAWRWVICHLDWFG
jgi:hypothetical protein